MRKILYLIMFFSSLTHGKLCITTPDTIMDGKWFDVKIVAFPPIPNQWVTLRAVPAYVEDADRGDSLELFPNEIQFAAGGDVWNGQLFYKNKKVSPEDMWVKIEARPALIGAPDSSKTIFAFYGPFSSSSTSEQIRVIPNPIGAFGGAEITVWRKGVVRKAEIKIFDSFGHLVKDLSNKVNISWGKLPKRWPNTGVPGDGDYTIDFATLYTKWDGRNSKGHKVANGVYQICVKTVEAEEAAIWKEKIGVIW